MAKQIVVNAGEIFCIPLFMSKEDWQLKEKLSDKDFRLRHLATETETPITREEIIEKGYHFSKVWYPIDLENRILEKISATQQTFNYE